LCPLPFHRPAFDAIHAALTKGLEDAMTIVEEFTTARNELVALDHAKDRREWVWSLAVAAVAADRGGAAGIVQEVASLIELCDAVELRGVEVSPCASISEGLEALTGLNDAVHSYDRMFATEGLPENERASLKGLDVETSLLALERAVSDLASERDSLRSTIQLLKSQLNLIGSQCDTEASTIAELRTVAKEVKGQLTKRRQELRSSLGGKVFSVVESMSGGVIPSPGKVDDGSLGAAIRKAVDCGYQIRLEAPREDQ